MLLSALAALGGMGLQFGMGQLNSAINTSRQVDAQKELMNYQWNLQKKYTQNYHQWNTSSLRASGINPMLSGNYGGGSAGGYGASVSGGDDFNAMQAANSGLDLGIKKSNLDTAESQAEIAKTNSAFAKQNNEIDIANKEADLISKASDIGLKQAQIDNINSSTAANLLENKWRGTQHYTEYRYGKELRELYPTSNLETMLSPVLRPIHSALSPFGAEEGGTTKVNPIVIKKGSKWTKYNYKYFNRK